MEEPYVILSCPKIQQNYTERLLRCSLCRLCFFEVDILSLLPYFSCQLNLTEVNFQAAPAFWLYSLETSLVGILNRTKSFLKQKWQWLVYTEESLVILDTADFIIEQLIWKVMKWVVNHDICERNVCSTLEDQSCLHRHRKRKH